MPSDDEVILAVIPSAVMHADFTGVKSRTFSLVLTDQRILFARLTTSRAHELSGQPFPEKKRVSESAATADDALLNEHYRSMKPAAILAEHKSNFAIDRGDITKMKVKYTGGVGEGTIAEILTIKTAEHTYKLALRSSKQARKALKDAGML